MCPESWVNLSKKKLEFLCPSGRFLYSIFFQGWCGQFTQIFIITVRCSWSTSSRSTACVLHCFAKKRLQLTAQNPSDICTYVYISLKKWHCNTCMRILHHSSLYIYIIHYNETLMKRQIQKFTETKHCKRAVQLSHSTAFRGSPPWPLPRLSLCHTASPQWSSTKLFFCSPQISQFFGAPHWGHKRFNFGPLNGDLLKKLWRRPCSSRL